MKKYKLKQFLAVTLAATMLLSTNAFATPINLDDSTANASQTDTLDKTNGTDHFADETTNVWQNGSISEEVRVTVDRASRFEITIPKEIVLNGNDGSASYNVSVTGEIAGDQVISVVPDASFTLNEDGGKQTSVTVTQNDTDFTYVQLDANTPYSGSLSAPEISAGNWSGSFYFNIEFKASAGPVLPAKAAFNNMSWADIATVSEAGEAANYFNVGDEKELQIGSETYHVQILGFNHDDKSDGTGKAGITVGLKEIMTTTKAMNSSGSNVGGWEASEMRTYLQNDILPTLPSDLQSVIKTVNKVSDGGYENQTLKTTQDKLFLFSPEEVGFNLTSYYVQGQGTKYDYFTDNTSRTKKYLDNNSGGWWLRSAITSNANYFYIVYSDGIDNFYSAYRTSGVVFGFSI